MMVSPEWFVAQLKDAPYPRLIKERDALIRKIRKFEREEKAGGSISEWQVDPDPEVQYQMQLEYLSALLAFMREKYNTEYVYGEKKLSDPE